jgi:hypothetical protein
MGWFFTASFISLLLGMFCNILNRSGLNLSNVDLGSVSEVTQNSKYIFENFIEHIVLKVF